METINTEASVQKPGTVPVPAVAPIGAPITPTSTVWFTPLVRNVLIVSGVLVVLLLIVAGLTLGRHTAVTTTTTLPSSLPVQSATPSAQTVSEFSKTPDFIEFSKNLDDFRNQVDKADLSEPNLSYPLLDMNVNFQKN